MATIKKVPEQEVVISVRDLKISFFTDNGRVHAVRGVSFDLYKGEILCIVGESGSGKSVSAKTIMGILPGNARIDSGSIMFEGEDLTQVSEEEFHRIRGNKIGMIFQDPLSSLNPIMKVGKQITEAVIINSDKMKQKFDDIIAPTNIKYKNDQAKIFHKVDGIQTAIALRKKETKEAIASVKAISKRNQVKKLKADLREEEIKINREVTTLLKKLDLAIQEEKKKISLAQAEIETKIAFKNNEFKEAINAVKADKLLNEEEKATKVKSLTAVFEKEKIQAENDIANLKTKLIPLIQDRDEKVEAAKKAALEKITLKRDEKNKEIAAVLADDSISVAVLKEKIRELKLTLRDDKAKAKREIADYKAEMKPIIREDKAKLKVVKKEAKAEVKAYKADLVKKRDEKIASLGERLKSAKTNGTKAEVKKIEEEIAKVKSEYVDSIKITRSEAKKMAIKVMTEVGIPNAERRYKQYPFEFSGGMRQRIVIAIALTQNPDILILDEPTTALDVTIQAQILELVNNLKRNRNLSAIFITHDLGVVANMADRVAVMYAGKIVEYGLVNEIFYDPRHPYTWALLSSIPDIDSKERLEAIPGTPPNMIYPPVGDAFALRSHYAMAVDFKKEPPLFKVSDTHFAATWLLDPRAPKAQMPKIVSERIRISLARAKKEEAKVK
ncbi:MAG TPA: ATP-binding cassette domain-containing protein [Bacilli bacterium]|nr:ATP-binding cassette domain-containing protein [Bacilli bacterium]